MYGDGGLPLRFSQDGSHEVDQATLPRPQRTFQGVDYLLEHALRPDLSLVKAHTADRKGNLRFCGTARNSNPDCAVAAKQTLVEAEHIVPVGSLDPDQVHLPGIYVHGLILATNNDKIIERLRLQKGGRHHDDPVRSQIARRAARELRDGMYVNLGIGLPTLTANYIPEGVKIELQAENGLLGVGPYPSSAMEASADWINAGKETITAKEGASTFGSSDSFGMIRGRHIDLTILGGLQCSARGDLASWIVPRKIIKVSIYLLYDVMCLLLCGHSNLLSTGNGRGYGFSVIRQYHRCGDNATHHQGRGAANIGQVYLSTNRIARCG